MRTFDVILFDDAGHGFSPRIAAERGLGGVEWTLILLAEALARSGRDVLVLSNFDGGWIGSNCEFGHVSRAYAESFTCDALIVSRWSAVPPIAHRRLVFSMHDIPERWMFGHAKRYLDKGAPAVCVSGWLAGKLGDMDPAWFCPVIEPMMLDECYDRGGPLAGMRKDPNAFVYASSAVKGLTETIETWALIREHFQETHLCELLVATNYDKPSAKDAKRMADLGVRYIGQLPARAMLAVLRNSAGMFYVNSFPETFCLVAAAALALGCRTHVLTLAEPGALPTTLAGSPLLTSSKHAFVERFVSSYLKPDDSLVVPAGKVPDRRMRALLPAWNEVLDG